jgi:hypothetical protein
VSSHGLAKLVAAVPCLQAREGRVSVDPVAACHVRALMLQNEDALLHTAVRWTCWGAPACGRTGATRSLMG